MNKWHYGKLYTIARTLKSITRETYDKGNRANVVAIARGSGGKKRFRLQKGPLSPTPLSLRVSSVDSLNGVVSLREYGSNVNLTFS
jgi:hypothetical protein